MEKQYLELRIIPNFRIKKKLEKLGFRKQNNLPVRIRSSDLDNYQIFRKEFDAKFYGVRNEDIDYRRTFSDMSGWISKEIENIFGNSVQLGQTNYRKRLIGKYYHFKFEDELYRFINI